MEERDGLKEIDIGLYGSDFGKNETYIDFRSHQTTFITHTS